MTEGICGIFSCGLAASYAADPATSRPGLGGLWCTAGGEAPLPLAAIVVRNAQAECGMAHKLVRKATEAQTPIAGSSRTSRRFFADQI